MGVSPVLELKEVTYSETAVQDGECEEGDHSRLSPLCLQSLPSHFLWSSYKLCYLGTEDKHVEGGAWLGVPHHLHHGPLLAGGDGGAPDSLGGAQATRT